MKDANSENGAKAQSAQKEPALRKSASTKTKSARPGQKKSGAKSKSEPLVCRYCGSDDLAPSFIKRRDRRCRKCFSKRYGSSKPAKKPMSKK
jgi:hypothetical protein